MSDCELAYSSFQKPTRIVTINAAAGDKILDTHAGSGACLRAAYRTGHDFLGFEIDKDYYMKANERLTDEMAQLRFAF